MSNKSWTISRRTMLRGVGAMLALPNLEIMGQTSGKYGSVQDSSAPLRFLSFFVPNGMSPKDWDVKGSGKNYQISPVLAPLDKMRDDFTVVSGLENPVTGHVRMTGSFLTGVGINKGRAAISLDQQIAEPNHHVRGRQQDFLFH